jgi:hypothetical protein
MSNQRGTPNHTAEAPTDPLDGERDREWSPNQDEEATVDIAIEKPDDAKARQTRGNRGPDEQSGFGQGA